MLQEIFVNSYTDLDHLFSIYLFHIQLSIVHMHHHQSVVFRIVFAIRLLVDDKGRKHFSLLQI